MKEALFGRTAAETQRPGALRLVSLSTAGLNAVQNITHIEWAEVCVRDYLSRHASWNFLISTELALNVTSMMKQCEEDRQEALGRFSPVP